MKSPNDYLKAVFGLLIDIFLIFLGFGLKAIPDSIRILIIATGFFGIIVYVYGFVSFYKK